MEERFKVTIFLSAIYDYNNVKLKSMHKAKGNNDIVECAEDVREHGAMIR